MRLAVRYYLIFQIVAFSAMAQVPDFRESVYLSTNNTTLLCGETLRYSAFVYEQATGQLGEMSKLLYVELIDKKGNPLFQHKLRLSKGSGDAAYFIPTLIPTGTYQLIAYTRWMRNFQDFFSMPITIVNPYETPSEALVPTSPSIHVDIFPEGGAIIPDYENKVVLKITDDFGKPISQAFKLIDDTNATLSEIASDKTGLASFTITPDASKKYQLLYEDQQGTFQFLPIAVADQAAVSITTTIQSGSLKLSLMGSGSNDSYDIQIENSCGLVYQMSLEVNQQAFIKTTDWTEGAYRSRALKNDKIASERIFVIGNPDKRKQNGIPTITFDQNLRELSLVYDQEAHVSLSIWKKSTLEKSSPTLSAYRFFGALQEWSSASDLTGHELDSWLLTAHWRMPRTKPQETIQYLPEIRGEIISGSAKIGGKPIEPNALIAYAITGHDYQLSIATSDSLGAFHIQINPMNQDRRAYMTLVNDTSAATFNIESSFLEVYPALSFPEVRFSAEQIREIVDRSIHNQITNAYQKLATKTDSIVRKPQLSYTRNYVLDDYNRFPVMYEHFYEYVPMVSARSFNDKIKVHIHDPLAEERPALYLIDGLPTDPKRILKFSPYRVQSFGIIDKRFYYGPMVSDGVLALHTFQGDLQGFEPGPCAVRYDYTGLQPISTAYINGRMDSDTKTPNYNEELVWIPSIKINHTIPYNLRFKSKTTELRIKIEGLTSSGEPILIQESTTSENSSY